MYYTSSRSTRGGEKVTMRGKDSEVRYETLTAAEKVVAQEADGTVKFGHGEGSAYLFDPDIYTDGRISVQGIDGVLFPLEEKPKPETTSTKTTKKITKPTKTVTTLRRGLCFRPSLFFHSYLSFLFFGCTANRRTRCSAVSQSKKKIKLKVPGENRNLAGRGMDRLKQEE
uniref:Uncharacterized protein n=1 Tax=Nelumbo nucifera TaxID=4432 RepID=A0A822YAA0_NELNU|nr:TPA_asm: hypothetical protein HUJ06_030491 [Nelumbo nucifera]